MGNPAPVLVPHGVDALLAPGVTTPRLTAWRLDCRAYPHQRDRLWLRPQPTNGVNERLLRYTHSAKVIGRVAVSRPRASLSLRARVQKPTTIAPTPLALSLADTLGSLPHGCGKGLSEGVPWEASYGCTNRGPATSKRGFEALEIRLLDN